MKNRFRYSVMILTVLALGMTACGDGEDAASNTADTVQGVVDLVPQPLPEPEYTETEQAILDYELQYSKGEFSLEDYHVLAGLYQEQGLIRKQRNLLEQSYRLHDDQQAFEMLQNLSVNLDEEEQQIQEQGKLMLQNLELEEYLNESINLISSKEWFDTMMPKLYEGSRTYFLQRNGETVLLIQVGYDEQGAPYSDVWFMGEQVKVLRYSGDAVQLLVTGLADGRYQGAFESWLCDGKTGDIYHETGTFADGVLTGDYTVAIHTGAEGSDVYSLWCNKEGMEYTTYKGNFDEQGKTTLEQPAANKIKSLIKGTDFSTCKVYAYDVDNARNCLFEGLAEGVDAENFAFGIEAMGWKIRPEFTTYDVVEDFTEDLTNETDTTVTIDVSDIKIRVLDGELQMFVNDSWINMGTAEQYVKEDPFQAYISSRTDAENSKENDGDTQSGTGFGKTGANRVEGEIPKDEVKPATKPAVKPTPAPAPEPAPAPSPEPDDEDDEDDDDEDHDEPAPAPEPEPDNSGSDVDVEWTPDIL